MDDILRTRLISQSDTAYGGQARKNPRPTQDHQFGASNSDVGGDGPHPTPWVPAFGGMTTLSPHTLRVSPCAITHSSSGSSRAFSHSTRVSAGGSSIGSSVSLNVPQCIAMNLHARPEFSVTTST
jgi:hypothetical protein